MSQISSIYKHFTPLPKLHPQLHVLLKAALSSLTFGIDSETLRALKITGASMYHEHQAYTIFKWLIEIDLLPLIFGDDLVLGSFDNVCKHLAQISSSVQPPPTILIFMLRGKNYRKQVASHIIQGLWMMIS